MIATSLWDPLQREVLEALGHPLHRATGIAVGGELPDDPIIDALLRAAGRDRNAEDGWRLVRAWPSPQALRGNARAKRALWPQLRALRRPVP